MATSERKAPLKKRAVAGSFLFKIPNGDVKRAKVALFRRSSKVRTYQHKLAPCSGSVEEHDPSPLDAALREIREETALPASSLDLLRIGKPYSFIDESIGREWSINPFAFRLKDVSEGGKGEEGITLDWEHEGIEWFDPMQVNGSDEFGGVPRLVDSLRRVWPEYDLGPEAGRLLTEGLQKLHDDHEHGARELTGMAVSTLQDVIRQMSLSDPIDESWWLKVCMVAWHICYARPSMNAAITSAMVKALGFIRAVYLSEMVAAADKAQKILQVLDQQLSKRNSMTDLICQSFIDYVRLNVLRDGKSKQTVSILTLSSSSTISNCLSQAVSSLGVALDMRILESRPLFEGVSSASRMLQDNQNSSDLKVTLYSDASVALAARGIDLVLLGADRISSSGDKIGSLPAVLSARYVTPNAKVLVLSDTEKIAGPGSMEEHDSEENSSSELSRAWEGTVQGAQVIENASSHDDPRVAVKNTYFEWVSAGLIDTYVTEEGLLSKEQIQQKSEWISNEYKRFFEDSDDDTLP
ncbi:translation initiation factor eIF-2B subunit family protein [Xylaria grammica]|nr:translation initiation factor eIF-2B subunit family protein [Xylaria grammica]